MSKKSSKNATQFFRRSVIGLLITSLEQCIGSTTFYFFNNSSPVYINHIFKPTGHPNTNTRTSFLKLNQPLRNSYQGEKHLYLEPNI